MGTLKKIILGTLLAFAPLASVAGLSQQELEQKWNEARIHPEQRQSFLEQLTNSIALPSNITAVIYTPREKTSAEDLHLDSAMALNSSGTLSTNGFSNYRATLEFFPGSFGEGDSYIQNYNDFIANFKNHELDHLDKYLNKCETFSYCLDGKGGVNTNLWLILTELDANKNETEPLVVVGPKGLKLNPQTAGKYSMSYVNNSLTLANLNYIDLTNYLEHAEINPQLKEKLKAKYNFPFLKYGSK